MLRFFFRHRISHSAIALGAALACQFSYAVPVSLLDPALVIEGAWYAQRSPDRIVLARHAESVLADPGGGISNASRPYALTQAGVRLRFRTDSPRIVLHFAPRAGGANLSLRQGFAVHVDGREWQVAETLDVAIDAPGPGMHDYAVSLPSYRAVDLRGMQLADGFRLAAAAPDHRPVLVAIGDSNTNGLGQQSASHLGYAAVLARRRAWNLVNLGVSGAAIGPALADELAGRRVDIVTVALGFNDWYWHGATLAQAGERYGLLLERLRRAQPQALIVAITPLATSADPRRALAPYSLERLRAEITAIVLRRRAAGDTRVQVVAGDALSDTTMLVDGIHLSVEGASRYARALDKVLPEPRQARIAHTALETSRITH